MKLYIFRPEWHGECTLWVMAQDEEKARKILNKYSIEQNDRYEFPWTTNLIMETYWVWEVFINDNH